MDRQTKKILKVIGLCFVLFLLTGCATNIKDGKLIAERAITESTPWNASVGWFDFIFVFPIAKSIIYISKYLGNIVASVIIVTIIINIIILPIMIKTTISSQKMQLIQPEVEKIQRKYQGRKDQASQMRLQEEIRKLYKKNDVSMWGSFTAFLSLPIMLAMWQGVQRIEILYHQNFLGVNLGANLSKLVGKINISAIILFILVGLTQYIAMQVPQIMSKRNPRYKETAQIKSMKKMNYFMVVMFLWISLSQPIVMSFYWITSNIIGVIKTLYIQFYHIEKPKQKKV